MSEGAVRTGEHAFLVLVKDGVLRTIECARADVFKIARARNAGICGVFATRIEADSFVNAMDILPPCMWPPQLT